MGSRHQSDAMSEPDTYHSKAKRTISKIKQARGINGAVFRDSVNHLVIELEAGRVLPSHYEGVMSESAAAVLTAAHVNVNVLTAPLL